MNNLNTIKQDLNKKGGVPNYYSVSNQGYGVTYTAPMNGWFFGVGQSNANGTYNTNIYINGVKYCSYHASSGSQNTSFLYPIAKGLQYRVDGASSTVRFLPSTS